MQAQLAAASRRLDRRQAQLQRRQAPAAVMQRNSRVADAGVELVQHAIARIALHRQLDRAHPRLAVHQQAARRLTDVALLATDDGQAEEGLVRRGDR